MMVWNLFTRSIVVGGKIMVKKTKSARGELVDFDLLKIKEQMASSPPPVDVRARQDFIDKRLRRRLKKVVTPAPRIENKNVAIPVAPAMPRTEDLNAETRMITEVELVQSLESSITPTVSKQKARPPKVSG